MPPFSGYDLCCRRLLVVSAYNKNEIGDPFRGNLSHFFAGAICNSPVFVKSFLNCAPHDTLFALRSAPCAVLGEKC